MKFEIEEYELEQIVKRAIWLESKRVHNIMDYPNFYGASLSSMEGSKLKEWVASVADMAVHLAKKRDA